MLTIIEMNVWVSGDVSEFLNPHNITLLIEHNQVFPTVYYGPYFTNISAPEGIFPVATTVITE